MCTHPFILRSVASENLELISVHYFRPQKTLLIKKLGFFLIGMGLKKNEFGLNHKDPVVSCFKIKFSPFRPAWPAVREIH